MDDEEAEEGLAMLLGVLATCDMSLVEWDAKDDEDSQHHKQSSSVPDLKSANDAIKASSRGRPAKPRIYRTIPAVDSSQDSPDVMFRHCYERAYSLSPDGRMSKPPVTIVDISRINNRGYALLASRNIRRGEIIYTERAAEACQMPHRCLICDGRRRGGAATQSRDMYRVRGCNYCFRSMEPASSILCKDCEELPMTEFWPIAEYQHGASIADISEKELGDVRYSLESRTGRVQCLDCQTLFCSKQCFDNYSKRVGTCCQGRAAVQAVVHATSCSINRTEGGDGEGVAANVDPSLILATRAFCAEIHRYRDINDSSRSHGHSPFYGMCGDSSDIFPLELGILRQEECQDTPIYSLEGAYDALCASIGLDDKERIAFPLASFERLASVAARNGVSITTKSPFREYYSAICRANGGRSTDRHKKTVKEVACALGSPDGELRRDMDREVEEKCAVQIATLFTLTARINHSCDPCAEIRGGEFIDCHVDMVAKRDIEAGEEISISYINLGKSAGRAATDGNKRRRELKARYLFDCDCSRCQDEY